MPRLTTFTVRAMQGGRLVTTKSPENVGAGNYSVKTNWRRLADKEILREGTKLLRPNTGLAQGSQHLNLGGTPVLGMWEAVRPNDERALVAATATTIYRYNYSTGVWDTVGTGFSAETAFWQGDNLDGYLVLNNAIDLMVTLRVEDSNVVPIYEMRDQGIAAVGYFAIYNGFLFCADITEIASTSLVSWMNGGTPYGLVPSNICNRIRYKMTWSDYGQPRNWAPVITGTIQSATKNKVTLSFPAPFSFPVGSKLAILGAGPNGTTLGGQPGLDDGVTVTSVTGADIMLSASADAALTYPLTVSVTRFADTSTFVGSASIKDDSSPILAIRPLKQVLVIYRHSGIWLGRYTGVVTSPFQFKPAYAGSNVPTCPHAIIDVQGDYHLYASDSNFYFFDGAGDPRIHEVMDDASTQFFNGITADKTQTVFARHNVITREIWFHAPNGILAYDYLENTVSWIDEAYGASLYARRPGSLTEYWFIMSKLGTVVQYGATAQGAITYQRLGVPVVHTIGHGEVHLNDDENEKDLLSYMPLFTAINNPVTVSVFGRDNIADTTEQLFSLVLTNPARDPLVETFYRNIYFQDRVQYTSVTDVPAVYAGSTYTFDSIRSQGVTRNDHGNQ